MELPFTKNEFEDSLACHDCNIYVAESIDKIYEYAITNLI